MLDRGPGGGEINLVLQDFEYYIDCPWAVDSQRIGDRKLTCIGTARDLIGIDSQSNIVGCSQYAAGGRRHAKPGAVRVTNCICHCRDTGVPYLEGLRRRIKIGKGKLAL